jgi:hypothetical protein
MTTTTEIRIPAQRYQDEDDCLSTAARDYASSHDLAGWDLSPRWADDQRDEIVLTVPAHADRRLKTYAVSAPQTPGAAPTVVYYPSLRAAREAARKYGHRRDLRGQDVRIEDAEGNLIEYAGPCR